MIIGLKCCEIDVENTELFSPQELDKYHSFQYERRKRSFVISKAITYSLINSTGNVPNKHYEISHGIFHQPILKTVDKRISIAHSDNYGTGILFPSELCIGLDIEEIGPRSNDVAMKLLSRNEELIVESNALSTALIMWTLKEALSKALLVGFTADINIYEIKNIKQEGDYYISGFTYFPAFTGISYCGNNHVFSIVIPKKTYSQTLLMDMQPLLVWLDS